jgi:hypothetical protein
MEECTEEMKHAGTLRTSWSGRVDKPAAFAYNGSGGDEVQELRKVKYQITACGMEVKVLIQTARPENIVCFLGCNWLFVTAHVGSHSWTQEHQVCNSDCRRG